MDMYREDKIKHEYLRKIIVNASTEEKMIQNRLKKLDLI